MRFGILVYPWAEELDFQGTWEMVGKWHTYGKGPTSRCWWRRRWRQ